MTRKKTHEEYVAELKEKNPNIIPIEQYINARTSILHKCLKHNTIWSVAPDVVLRGCGCVECGKEKNKNFNTKTHDQYVQDVQGKLSHISVVDTYKDSHTKITHYCNIHDTYWKVAPVNLLHGCGCPQCAKEQNFKNTRKTHDAYVAELAIVNPTVEVVEQYINHMTPILHHCLIHDVYWKISPHNALTGVKCKQCRIDSLREQRIKTQEEYINDVAVINSNIIVLGTYVNAQTKILHKCDVCGYEWMARPNGILNGTGCPMCAGNAPKTQKEYISELLNINPDITVLGNYSGANTPILHKCNIDGHEWCCTPSSILLGKGCPVCKESNGERLVRQWSEKHEITYVFQKTFEDCKDVFTLPFDFYLPEYNVCIEYQGEQHYKSIEYFGGEEKFKIQQKHDQIKRDYCKDNKIRLLEIPYWENVEESLNKFLFI